MDTSAKHTRESPAIKANFFSIVFFSWLDPLMKKGYKKRLEVDDLYSITEDNSSGYLCDRLEREWKREMAASAPGKTPSYQRAVLRCFRWQILALGIVAASEEVARVVQPILLARMLDYFKPTIEGQVSISAMAAYLYALGLALTSMVAAIMHHPHYFYNMVIGMRMRVASCAMIYRKALRLSHKSLATTTTGHIINLMSTDVARLDYATIFMHYLWLGPLQTVVVLGILWTHIGFASLSGFAFILLLTPVQGLLGKVYARLRMKTALETDERVRLMDQVIAGMKVIKMYCWEKPFSQLVADVRNREMRIVATASRLRLMSTEFGYYTFSKITVAACVVAFAFLHGRCPPLEVLVIVMRLIGIVQDSLAYNTTRGVSIWGEMSSTFKRIQDFLLLEEIAVPSVQSGHDAKDCGVEMRGFSGKWDGGSGTPALQNVTVSAGAGELLAVVGPVGAGKSSLLMALLGELPCVSGEVAVRGRIAYASQQPWIFSASLRQNVLFGCDYDADKYGAVVEACALDKDIEALLHGDQTLVGERGVILSGGQRARVGLARALYQDADIYLLDDPLSAVDPAVAKHLFDRCINGYLKDRPRVLVTHQLHFLHAAKRVLVLVDGSAMGVGSYEELANSGVDFAELLKHDGDRHADAAEGAPQHLRPPCALRSLSASAAEAALGSSIPDLLTMVDIHRSFSQLHMGEGVDDSMLSVGVSTGIISACQATPNGMHKASAEEPLLTKAGVDRSAPVEAAAEHMEEGGVSLGVYLKYFHSGTNACTLVAMMLLLAAGQVLLIVIDWYLAQWSSVEDAYQASFAADINGTIRAAGGVNATQRAYSLDLSNVTLPEMTIFPAAIAEVTSVMPELISFDITLLPMVWTVPSDGTPLPMAEFGGVSSALGSSWHYNAEVRLRLLCIYTALIVGLVGVSILRTVAFCQVCMNASKKLHDLMFASIVRTSMRFFDTNPVGRILNRFSKDIGNMDDLLPLAFFDFLTCAMVVIGTVIMATVTNPWVLIPLLPILIVLILVRRLYVASSRAIKRLEGITRSPVFSHLSATLNGLHTVRAFGAQTTFCEEFDTHQDGHTETFYLFLCAARWLAIRLDWMCVLFVTAVTFLCLFAKDNVGVNASMFGLTITYTMALMGLFQWVVRQSIEIENMMTSVERIEEYSCLLPEGPLVTSVRPSPGWPHDGCLEADSVNLRYAANEPLVLKNVTFHINGAEKVGICGRTGAGKSSLLAALFRLSEPSGRLTIDGVQITDIGLHDLRSKLSIIPQDPVLFSTSVRRNLDPFFEHSDPALWDALQQVQLWTTVQELTGGLDAAVAEGGSNFSVGQRQLLCLARAILRKNKILVVDEATANVDPRTDAAIQETIRDKFAACTVLTIAHRLNTIVDSDRVMVLEDGCVREFDEPHVLLQQPDSLFRALVAHTGKEFSHLCALAREAHNKRRAAE